MSDTADPPSAAAAGAAATAIDSSAADEAVATIAAVTGADAEDPVHLKLLTDAIARKFPPLAGIRIEPPVSEPRAAKVNRAATAAPDPEDEPPVT